MSRRHSSVLFVGCTRKTRPQELQLLGVLLFPVNGLIRFSVADRRRFLFLEDPPLVIFNDILELTEAIIQHHIDQIVKIAD